MRAGLCHNAPLDDSHLCSRLYCGQAVRNSDHSSPPRYPVQGFLHQRLALRVQSGRGLQHTPLARLPHRTGTDQLGGWAGGTSSSRSTLGLVSTALAMAIRCFCPPLSLTPALSTLLAGRVADMQHLCGPGSRADLSPPPVCGTQGGKCR